MTERKTLKKTYKLDSEIEVWLEPDPYCPRILVSRPKALKNSISVLSQTGVEFQSIIKNPEAIFIEDLLYNFIGNEKYCVENINHVADQLIELANKIKRMVINLETTDEDL